MRVRAWLLISLTSPLLAVAQEKPATEPATRAESTPRPVASQPVASQPVASQLVASQLVADAQPAPAWTHDENIRRIVRAATAQYAPLPALPESERFAPPAPRSPGIDIRFEDRNTPRDILTPPGLIWQTNDDLKPVQERAMNRGCDGIQRGNAYPGAPDVCDTVTSATVKAKEKKK